MVKSSLFTEKDAWTGGSFELAIEFENVSDEKLLQGLRALWSYSFLEGCYKQNNVEPSNQAQINANIIPLSTDHLYGIATLPNDKQIGCSTVLIREEKGSDWIILGLPMGALGEHYSVGAYPINDGNSVEWKREIEAWFINIAEGVFSKASFRLALTGWNAGGDTYAIDVAVQGIPKQRWHGFLWCEENKLKWYPPTEKYEMEMDS